MRFNPIGFVKSDQKERVDNSWGDKTSIREINSELKDGLRGLEDFSHIIVVYCLHEAKFEINKHLTRKPQGREDMPEVGIFAQRAKDRPNPIGITAVKLIEVDANKIVVEGLDAIDDTPILDIKPYYPAYDRRDAQTPDWVDILMQNYF